MSAGQHARERRALRAHVARMERLYRIVVPAAVPAVEFPADVDGDVIGERQRDAVAQLANEAIGDE